MDKKQVKRMENVCLAPFKKAQEMLLKAENRMAEMHRYRLEGKSEIRMRFEKFEENISSAWERALTQHGVDHVFALPIPVYRQIVQDYIHQPGSELTKWLSGEAAKLKLEVRENPYVIAGAALVLSYNLVFDDYKEIAS